MCRGDIMGTSRTKANNKYNAKAYDRLAVQVYKGSREIIQNAAAKSGESTNAYIVEAIDRRMKSEGLDGLPSKPPATPVKKQAEQTPPAQPIEVKSAETMSDDEFRERVKSLREQHKADGEADGGEQEIKEI